MMVYDSGVENTLRTLRQKLADFDINAKVTSLKELCQEFWDRASNMSAEEWEELVKLAWSYEEQNCQKYTLAEAISWVKEHFDPEKYSAACLYKMERPDSIATTLHLVYLDKEQQPCLTGADPHRVVICLGMDKDLEKQFGDKNMIVFQ